jgi:hypothetical protein
LSNANGYKAKGDIELVGTLRNGTLIGSSTEGNTYMGLKENQIYYPNTDLGSTIWAYRGIFRSSEILDKESMQKMRIIVDGEDRGELIIDADGDVRAPEIADAQVAVLDNLVLELTPVAVGQPSVEAPAGDDDAVDIRPLEAAVCTVAVVGGCGRNSVLEA